MCQQQLSSMLPVACVSTPLPAFRRSAARRERDDDRCSPTSVLPDEVPATLAKPGARKAADHHSSAKRAKPSLEVLSQGNKPTVLAPRFATAAVSGPLRRRHCCMFKFSSVLANTAAEAQPAS